MYVPTEIFDWWYYHQDISPALNKQTRSFFHIEESSDRLTHFVFSLRWHNRKRGATRTFSTRWGNSTTLQEQYTGKPPGNFANMPLRSTLSWWQSGARSLALAIRPILKFKPAQAPIGWGRRSRSGVHRQLSKRSAKPPKHLNLRHWDRLWASWSSSGAIE